MVPKIWVDLGAALTGTDLKDVITDPLTALKVIVEAGILCGADAVRQFHFPERGISADGERVLEIDSTGGIVGEIDMKGGLVTRLFDPEYFDLESPYFMTYHHYWSSDAPFVRDLRDAGRIKVPDKRFLRELGLEERQKKIRDEYGERIALLGDCSSATMAFLVCMRGMGRAMFDLIENPDLVHAVMEKGVAIAVEKGKFNLDMGMKILRLNDSVGNMSVISPEHWRKFVFPHLKEVCDALHSYDSDARVYCHICGNILPIAEDLVQSGLDCIAPLDPLGGFTPADVRRRVGDAVSLMGGVDTLSFINRSPEELVDEAKGCILGAGRKGGFILGSGCVIPRSARIENLVALSEAALRYGVYQGDTLRLSG